MVIPCLRYRDAPAAIEWLCRVLGFEKHAVYPNPDGTIAHAQLILGRGMVMLGSMQNDTQHEKNAWSRQIKQPDEIEGCETQSPYLFVVDADVVYARVKASSDARIVIDIKDEDYGGRGFSCCDPEGHLWSIGTYDPWQTAAA